MAVTAWIQSGSVSEDAVSLGVFSFDPLAAARNNDANFATALNGTSFPVFEPSQWLVYTNWDLSTIPNGSTITQVEIRVRGYNYDLDQDEDTATGAFTIRLASPSAGTIIDEVLGPPPTKNQSAAGTHYAEHTEGSLSIPKADLADLEGRFQLAVFVSTFFIEHGVSSFEARFTYDPPTPSPGGTHVVGGGVGGLVG